MNYKNIKEELSLDILWRYQELKNIKKIYDKNVTKTIIKGIERIQNTPESKYILRSSVPMIYAHWEGFFKKSIEVLNHELDQIDIDFNKLDNILLASLCRDKHNAKHKNIRLNFSDIIIDTESNVSWKVIEKFYRRYNFKIIFLERYKHIIEQLLKARNRISHGENAYHYEDFDKIHEYIQIITRLMILHRNNIIRCLKYKTYYKNNTKC